MTTLTGPTVKRCPSCGETKTLSEYHRNRARRDGRASECKPCATSRVRRAEAKERVELGNDAWRDRVNAKVRSSRSRRRSDTERSYRRAKQRATRRLVEMHPRAFKRLLAIELDAERRGGRRLYERTAAK